MQVILIRKCKYLQECVSRCATKPGTYFPCAWDVPFHLRPFGHQIEIQNIKICWFNKNPRSCHFSLIFNTLKPGERFGTHEEYQRGGNTIYVALFRKFVSLPPCATLEFKKLKIYTPKFE